MNLPSSCIAWAWLHRRSGIEPIGVSVRMMTIPASHRFSSLLPFKYLGRIMLERNGAKKS